MTFFRERGYFFGCITRRNLYKTVCIFNNQKLLFGGLMNKVKEFIREHKDIILVFFGGIGLICVIPVIMNWI